MNQIVTTEQRQPASSSINVKTLVAGGGINPIIPQTMDDVYRLGKVVVSARMAPKDMQTPEACAIAILHGLEIGLPPMQALQRIAVINGRPTIWGDAAMALVRASGKALNIKEWFEGEGDKLTAVCLVVRKDDTGSPIKSRFSVDDAKTAKLWMKKGRNGQDTPWVTNPKRMLQMRARGFALRDGFADVLGGLYLTEEIQGTEAEQPHVMAPPPSPPAQETIEAETIVEASPTEAEAPSEPEPETKPLIEPDAYDGTIEDLRSRLVDAPDLEILGEVWDEAQSVWEDIMEPDQAELMNTYNERFGAMDEGDG